MFARSLRRLFRRPSFSKDSFIPHFIKAVYPYQLVYVFQLSPLTPGPDAYEPTTSVPAL